MAEKKKKFGANGLNALESAIETVSEAVENQQTESSQIVASTPVVEPTVEAAPQPTIATKQEQKKTIESESTTQFNEERSMESNTVVLNELAKKEIVTVEKTKGINVPLSIPDYIRLFKMKTNLDGETMKSLGVKAVIEYLDRNGY